MGNKALIALQLCLTILTFLISKGNILAQESSPDSIIAARLMEDNLALYQQTDSLELAIHMLHVENDVLLMQIDSLQSVVNVLEMKFMNSKDENDSLIHEQVLLNREILANKQSSLKLNTQLELQSQLLRDKDYQLSKLELEQKELKSLSELNKVKQEGKQDLQLTKLEGKETEIVYLKKSIEEKDILIKEKTGELANYYHEKDNSLRIIDSLARALNQKELEYVKVSERLKLIEAQYNDLLAKQTAATNKKKKIRFIQGVGMRGFRAPDWQLAPKSSTATNDYVITNKNAGNIDFDYITGISLSLYDLTKDESKFTYDAGLFVGFGGQNLFKNFYIGPSFKIFDYFHVNIGANFAEYQVLKSGFQEGDPLPVGYSVSNVTVKQWKTNIYLGFTLDLELLANIPKKM